MAWLRIDDGFASHPKLAQLTDREFRVWMRLLCYCGRHRDPTVDEATIREVNGLNKRAISRFTSLSLLDPVDESWEVHDWLTYQPKDATNAARQAKWRSRVTALRNAERNGEVTEPDRYGNGPSRAGTRGKAPSRPVPVLPGEGSEVIDITPPPPNPEPPETSARTVDPVEQAGETYEDRVWRQALGNGAGWSRTHKQPERLQPDLLLPPKQPDGGN